MYIYIYLELIGDYTTQLCGAINRYSMMIPAYIYSGPADTDIGDDVATIYVYNIIYI